MANKEKIKVRVVKTNHINTWYKIGETHTVYESAPDFWSVNDRRSIYKSDCEIIPSADLIAFDWDKYCTGHYDAIDGNGDVITKVARWPDNNNWVVCLQDANFSEKSICAVQLRPRNIERWIIVFSGGDTSEIRTEKPVGIRHDCYFLKLTYSPGSDPGKDAPTHCEIVK